MQSTLTPSKHGREGGDTPYSTTSKNQDSLSKRVFNLAIDNQESNQQMVSESLVCHSNSLQSIAIQILTQVFAIECRACICGRTHRAKRHRQRELLWAKLQTSHQEEVRVRWRLWELAGAVGRRQWPRRWGGSDSWEQGQLGHWGGWDRGGWWWWRRGQGWWWGGWRSSSQQLSLTNAVGRFKDQAGQLDPIRSKKWWSIVLGFEETWPCHLQSWNILWLEELTSSAAIVSLVKIATIATVVQPAINLQRQEAQPIPRTQWLGADSWLAVTEDQREEQEGSLQGAHCSR